MTIPECFFSQGVVDLLVHAAHGDRHDLAARVPQLDTPKIVYQLEHNHLAGLLYLWLKEADCLDLLSRSSVQVLSNFYKRQWMRLEKLLFELGDLHDALTAAGRPFILLKGAHVSQRFFGSPEARAVQDLDILVRPDQLAEAIRIVEACGFRRISWLPLGLAASRKFTHYIDFAKGRIPLDLHHSLRVHPAIRIDYDCLWSTCGSIELKGRTFKVLSDEYILLLQILAVHYDIRRGRTRFRFLFDLLLMIRGCNEEIDWGSFFQKRRNDGTDRICAGVLALCLGLFECRWRYPALAGEIEKVPVGDPRFETREQALAFLCRTGSSARLFWWAGLFDWPKTLTLLWWIGGGPIRYATCGFNLLPGLLRSR